VNVRLATLDDVPAVAAILDEATAFVRSKGTDQWPVPFPQGELRERVVGDELYVVELDGETAGTFTLLLDDPWFWGAREADAVYLHMLAIRRSYAGRGLGTRVVAWIARHARTCGRAFIRLDCQRDLAGIRRYYEGLGFELQGEKENGRFAWALYERAVDA
jgi:GNAT superfamily N-acetyltransferase